VRSKPQTGDCASLCRPRRVETRGLTKSDVARRGSLIGATLERALAATLSTACGKTKKLSRVAAFFLLRGWGVFDGVLSLLCVISVITMLNLDVNENGVTFMAPAGWCL
jgi:hypothetical protein